MTYSYHLLRNAAEKTETIRRYAVSGAENEPLVRRVAVALVRGTDPNDHLARLTRLHQFVRDSIDYVREPVEMLHPASVTLEMGANDCDDKTILLGALAWSLKYPFIVRPVGPADNPSHYTNLVGYPQSDTPQGDASTTWVHAETTIPALTGEPVEAAERRLYR